MPRARKSSYSEWYHRISPPLCTSIYCLLHILLGFLFKFSAKQFILLSLGAIATSTCIMTTYAMDPGIVLTNSNPPVASDDDDVESGRLLDDFDSFDDDFQDLLEKGKDNNDIKKLDNNSNNSDIDNDNNTTNREQNEEATIDGVNCKWCATCEHWRKPNVTHCSDCGFCMKEFDHHCGVMGNCIAYRNHRPFVLIFFFAGLSTAYLLFHGSLYAHNLRLNNNTWHQFHWYQTLGALFLIAYEAFMMNVAFIGNLLMTTTGMTTKSLSRKKPPKKLKCSFIVSVILSIPRNIFEFWCHINDEGVHRSSHPRGETIGYLPCQ